MNPRLVHLRIAPALAALLVVASASAGAQRPDSVIVPRDSARPRDSVTVPGRLTSIADAQRPPLSARRAFFYSLLVPGLGQTRLDRPGAGALFASIEVAGLVMARKAAGDLRFARDVARTSAATGYQVVDGVPVRDTLGNLVPIGRERNRYSPRLRARRTQYEDWVALLAFNHLIAGAEAFVSANLWDMPARPTLRVADDRRLHLGASVDFGSASRR